MRKENDQSLLKQYVRYIEPDFEILNHIADSIIFTTWSNRPITLSDRIFWGVYVSVDMDTLETNIRSLIESYFKIRHIGYLLQYIGTSGESSQLDKPFISIGIKVGDIQESIELRQIENILFEPIRKALYDVIDNWFLRKFVQTLLPAARTGRLTAERWSEGINSMTQVINEHLGRISTDLSAIIQGLDSIPEITDIIDEFVEGVFNKIPPGSPEFSKILDEFSEKIASVYKRTFGEEMSGKEKESLRKNLSAKVATWDETEVLREMFRRSGLINLTAFLWNAAKITWKRRRLEGYGVWDLMKKKTKEKIFDLFSMKKKTKEEIFDLFRREQWRVVSRIGSLSNVIGKYLFAPLKYLDTVVGPDLGFDPT